MRNKKNYVPKKSQNNLQFKIEKVVPTGQIRLLNFDTFSSWPGTLLVTSATPKNKVASTEKV
jgi:hypothetical protein